jgi:hypothetical protein
MKSMLQHFFNVTLLREVFNDNLVNQWISLQRPPPPPPGLQQNAKIFIDLFDVSGLLDQSFIFCKNG